MSRMDNHDAEQRRIKQLRAASDFMKAHEAAGRQNQRMTAEQQQWFAMQSLNQIDSPHPIRHDELTDHWGVPEERPSAAVVWVVMAGLACTMIGICAGLVWWLL